MCFVSEGKRNKIRREDDKQVGEMMREQSSREQVGEITDTATCMLQRTVKEGEISYSFTKLQTSWRCRSREKIEIEISF